MTSCFKWRHVKRWTVLIYANGNCDLEPEISSSLLDMEGVGAGENVNVLVQMARAPVQLVEKFRPGAAGIRGAGGDWNGVRRYQLPAAPSLPGGDDFSSELLVDLGLLNMADPQTLEDFICWGIENYPARHYMLVLAGHGAGFMGAMTDFTQSCPQLMSTGGIRAAMREGTRKTGRKLDVLLLDTCYLNLLEVIYELGAGLKAPNFIITSRATPLEGLSYSSLMKIFNGVHQNTKPRLLTASIVVQLNQKLKTGEAPFFAIRSCRASFWFLKRAVSKIGDWAQSSNRDLGEYCTPGQQGFPVLNLGAMARALAGMEGAGAGMSRVRFNARLVAWCLRRLVYLQAETSPGSTWDFPVDIYFPDRAHFLMMEAYYQVLQFAAQNHWLYLLGGKRVQKVKTNLYRPGSLPPPLSMPLEGVHHVLAAYNSRIKDTEIKEVMQGLGWLECARLQHGWQGETR